MSELHKSLREGLKKILMEEVGAIGFSKAYFKDIPEAPVMELGVFYIEERDHKPIIQKDELLLELWFHQEDIPFQEEVLETRMAFLLNSTDTIKQVKYLITIPLQEITFIHSLDKDGMTQCEYIDSHPMNQRVYKEIVNR